MEQRRRPQPTGEIQKALELVADQMVWNTADREAIPAEERSEGYTVWQYNNRRFYRLVGGIGNEHWQELSWEAILGSNINLYYSTPLKAIVYSE
jgi:hypothetical protein